MINNDDIEKAAKLARIALTADEKVAIARDLGRVVDYVDALFVADVDAHAPLLRGPGVKPKTRPDVEQPVLGRDALTGNPGFDGALVNVPKVIE